MTLHSKKHTLQGGVQAGLVTSKGELVDHADLEETSAREMAPSQAQLKQNPYKTPPNSLTIKNQVERKRGTKQ